MVLARSEPTNTRSSKCSRVSGAGFAVEGITFNNEFTNLDLEGSKLVDTGWHIDPASAPTGCGGPTYEPYVDAALSDLLEVENAGKTGITWLKGDLHDGSRFAVVAEGKANGEIP